MYLLGGVHDAPLKARMHTHKVQPAVRHRGELDNDCLYLFHPIRRRDMHNPLAVRPISPNYSPDIIENQYLARVHSTDSTTTSAFMIHFYVSDSTPDIILNLIRGKLNEMHSDGAPTSADHIAKTMTVDPITDLDISSYIMR